MTAAVPVLLTVTVWVPVDPTAIVPKLTVLGVAESVPELAVFPELAVLPVFAVVIPAHPASTSAAQESAVIAKQHTVCFAERAKIRGLSALEKSGRTNRNAKSEHNRRMRHPEPWSLTGWVSLGL